MCTVSFIAENKKVFITSNRDEKHWRSTAKPPALYHLRSGNCLFPKDADAGGTWIAMHENGNLIVFLNGAWIKHDPKPPYKKSRGLLLIDLMDQDSPYHYFLHCDLLGIEPFTAIVFEREQLYECRWDGQNKFHVQLSSKEPHIWSSVTLYDEKVIKKRKEWFTEWLTKNPTPTQNDILGFHQFTGDGDKHNDLLMNRDGFVFTVSITSVEITEDSSIMQYLDIKSNESFKYGLSLNKATAP